MTVLEMTPITQTSIRESITEAVADSEARIVGTMGGKKVTLWNATHEYPQHSLSYSNTIAAIALSPDGSLLAISMVYRGCFIQVWRVAEIESVEELPVQGPQCKSNTDVQPIYQMKEFHSDLVQGLTFSRDGKWLASLGSEAEVGLWNVETGELADGWEPSMPATAVAFSANSKYLAFGTGTREGRLVIRSLKNGKEKLSANTGRGGKLKCIDFTPDNQSVIAGCRDFTLRRWKLTRKTPLFSITTDKAIERVCCSSDGRLIYAGLANGSVSVHDAETGEQLYSFQAHTTAICGLNSSDNQLMTASQFGEVTIWGTVAPE